MIAVSPILDIIETTLWTGMLKDEKPLSVLLIASVGSGKSEILRKSYKPPEIKVTWVNKKDKNGNNIIDKKTGKPIMERHQDIKQKGSVLYTTDSTPYVLYHTHGELLKSGQIKHIVIPDLLSILTKSKDVMPATIRFYNSLIEEGICRIESKISDFITEIPLQIGLITAVSIQDYKARSDSQNWGALGFLSRVLPVSFSYTDSSKKEILTSIFMREYHNETSFELNFPKEQVYVELPDVYMQDLIELSYRIKDPTDDIGARREKQVMTFVMANALKNGRDKVNKDDIDKIMEYERFFNTDGTAKL